MRALCVPPEGRIALVTGSNRGIGRAITIELLEKGAKKVYAGTRHPEVLDDLVDAYGSRLLPLALDVTDDASLARAAEDADDVEILVNNAGVLDESGFFSPQAVESLTTNLRVNVYGTLRTSRAFVTTLRAHDTAAIVSISSILGLVSMPGLSTYSASKATLHSMVQGMRGELARDNILVIGAYPGPINTRMIRNSPVKKTSPEHAAARIVQALIDGTEDVFPDAVSREIGRVYASNPKAAERLYRSSYLASGGGETTGRD